MTIFAKAGEWVTCESGHRICQIARDLELGELQLANDFTNWQQDEPAPGAMIAQCAVCGGDWYRGVTGLEMHIGGKWREPFK